ncbi:MAG: N-acetylmuramic acid 6-phosphate etherase [Acidobacteriota bacterium]
MNAEDTRVPVALRPHLPRLAEAVEAIAERWRRGGRVVYAGAGTSGRLGVLDAAEWPPTFGVPRDRVVALIAGGAEALVQAVEGAEDDAVAGEADVAAAAVAAADTVVGLAASGRTPYTIAALREARRRGALTLAVTCNPGSELGRLADFAVEVETGPEVVTGSTRLKAGTAQKLVLNMLSTALMVRLGYVYDNLMVNVQPSNEKLRQRAARIVVELTGADIETARRVLEAAGEVPAAVVMLRCGCSAAEARDRIRRHGSLRAALEAGA